jgi:hypothetical protein
LVIGLLAKLADQTLLVRFAPQIVVVFQMSVNVG